MRACIAASAIAEPDTPPISVASRTETWARPPFSRPASTVASASSSRVMPEWLRKLPAMMKSGIASSAKFCVCDTVSWIGMVEGSSGCCRKNTQPAMPIANATGMPMTSSTAKAIATQVTAARPGS
jgi:hypothetical protein